QGSLGPFDRSGNGSSAMDRHALTEPRLSVAEYPPDEWVQAQQYRNFSWQDTVDLWIGMNRLLVHVLLLVPEEKITMPVRVGVEKPISFLQLVERYLERSEDILGQILSRL